MCVVTALTSIGSAIGGALSSVGGAAASIGSGVASAVGGSSILPWLATGASVAGALSKSSAAKQEVQAQNQAADYNAAIQENNAKIAEMQAQQAQASGDIEEKQHRLRLSRLEGQQRSGMAASGALVESGSSLDALEDSALWGEFDALTLRHNTAQNVWGYKTQANNYRSQAQLYRMSKRNASSAGNSTLLSGLANANWSGFGTLK